MGLGWEVGGVEAAVAGLFFDFERVLLLLPDIVHDGAQRSKA